MVRSIFFFFNDTSTSEIYTLSLHDALPICIRGTGFAFVMRRKPEDSLAWGERACSGTIGTFNQTYRSEEHTSELQSPVHLVCRLLLEKKKPARRSTVLHSR